MKLAATHSSEDVRHSCSVSEKMWRPVYVLLACFSACAVHANSRRLSTKYIKLTFGVSKATYLPLNRYLQKGFIMENPPSLFGDNDKAACSIGGWTGMHFENEEAEAMMFTNVLQKLVVFGFRGTEATNWNEWEKNLETMLVPATIGSRTFHIHKGFSDRYSYISPWFENEYNQVPNDYTILLAGHSLGGAEATIAAAYAAGKLNRKPDAVVTYGSPKVGSSQFENYYQQMVGCDRTIRMVSKNDLSTSFPWGSLLYTHVCSASLEVDGGATLNPFYAHSLYGAYEDGIRKAFKNMNKINIGCDQTLQ